MYIVQYIYILHIIFHYIDCTDPTENTDFTVHKTRLPLGCLAIYVLLLTAIVYCGDMFTGPLPSSGMIHHIMLVWTLVNFFRVFIDDSEV
jgi:hypothetical protein